MSNWTKGFIGVAIASQVILFVILFGCKAGDAFYITSVDMFGIVLSSICTLLYIPAIVISHDSDKIRKKLDEQLQA
jgi:putative effector of murein hydrolase LrgA (UPF0299 family)